MADSPQDEHTNEGRITGTHTGPVAVEQGTDRTDGSDVLTYGDPSKDTSKLPTHDALGNEIHSLDAFRQGAPDQQPEQPQ